MTDIGRFFGSIIIIGVGVFGTLTGFLANVFMAPAEEVPDVHIADEGSGTDAAPVSA